MDSGRRAAYSTNATVGDDKRAFSVDSDKIVVESVVRSLVMEMLTAAQAAQRGLKVESVTAGGHEPKNIHFQSPNKSIFSSPFLPPFRRVILDEEEANLKVVYWPIFTSQGKQQQQLNREEKKATTSSVFMFVFLLSRNFLFLYVCQKENQETLEN